MIPDPRPSARPEQRPLDDVLAPCARSVAASADLQLDVGPDERPAAASASAADGPIAWLARGRSDRAAVRHRHHDADLYRRWLPDSAAAATLYEALEHERVEAVGARRLKGVGTNLDRLREHERGGSFGAVEAVADAVRIALRADTSDRDEASTAGDASGSIPAVDPEDPRSRGDTPPALPDVVAERLAAALPRLREQLHDQQRFARTARALAQALAGEFGDRSDASGADGGTSDGPGEPADPEDAGAVDDELDESDELDEHNAQDADNDAEDEEPRPPAPLDAQAPDGEPDTDTGDEARDEPPVTGRDPIDAPSRTSPPGYRAWTTRHDEVCRPAELADAGVLAGLREDLDRHIALQGRLVRRLAARLERVLMARQRREWQFDQDEGELDARRLVRLLSSPLAPLAFKNEVETRFRDTTITLLIDNSRSMLGRPITIAAAATDILARTLERCGVSVEVIGFTTVSLHGGRSNEDWQAAGSPAEPGRLNELRHILYKAADVPYRTARRGFGLMLSREILKQNIDGESLAWAHARLMKRPEQRRLLMVISDGAPVDTATLSANRRDYLARHLHQTIAAIERTGAVQLCAIGIGHDVGRYYRRAMTVHDARELGPAMLAELSSLLSETA